MDQLHVQKSHLSGAIHIPPSKSQSLRALVFEHLAGYPCEIYNLLDSPDIRAARSCFRKLGTDEILDVANSGLMLRFLMGIAALDSRPYTITGDRSLRGRPLKDLISGLEQLGVSVTSSGGFAPVTLKGPLKGGYVRISGHDSQPVSSLLIACAFAEGPSEIELEHPGEIPWVKLTLNWFDRLGIEYNHQDFRRFLLPGGAVIKPFTYHIPADLSSLAFPVVAALVTRSAISIPDVDLNDPQGDKRLLSILKEMGARIEVSEKGVTVLPSELVGVEVDINDCIDCIAALAVAAASAKGRTRIYNARVAREKECDRIACLFQELSKLGVRIKEEEDGLVIEGSVLTGAVVDSHDDHRMAMALTVAGMGASGETTIRGVNCIAKTFPHFCESFQTLGAEIR